VRENKILLITQEFPPDVGGCGVVAKSMAKYLSEAGVDVEVLTSSSISGTTKTEEGYLIRNVKRIPKVFPLLFKWHLMWRNLEQFKYIIINDVGAAFVASFFLSKKQQQKCIVYIQGGEASIFDATKTNLKLYHALDFKTRYLTLLKNAHHIMAVSQCVKNYLLEVSKLDQIKEKMSVIYPSLDLDIFYPEPINLHEKYSIEESSQLLLSAGRIDIKKGYERQYLIFKKLISKNPSYHWIIVGVGPYSEELKQKIKKDKLEKFITIDGRLTQSELRKYYSSVNLFWQLSIWESLGLVYLEANACGTPVIGTAGSGISEVIDSNVSGYLVTRDEECLQILLEKSYTQIKESALSEHVREFNLKREKILDVIKN